MAMQPTLSSVNPVTTELGLDRRTVAKRLAAVPPSGEKAGHPVWRLAETLPALTLRQAPEAAPSPPTGLGWLADVPPRDAQAGLAPMLLAHGLPQAVASLAASCGASCRAACATVAAMPFAGPELVGEEARDFGRRPWSTEDDPGAITPDAFEGVDWGRRTEMAGEPLDLDCWARWPEERFAAAEAGTPGGDP